MEELSIVIGLIIVIVLFIMYNRYQIQQPCDEYVAYFDKMYYELPELKTLPEEEMKKQSLNDMRGLKQQMRKVRSVGDATNVMKSRWASQHDLHDKISNGSVDFTNTDKQVEPAYLQHQLRNGRHRKNDVVKNHGQQNVITEGFADDEWADENFSFNEKYTFDNDNIGEYDYRHSK
jgi:hypothetical protein